MRPVVLAGPSCDCNGRLPHWSQFRCRGRFQTVPPWALRARGTVPRDQTDGNRSSLVQMLATRRSCEPTRDSQAYAGNCRLWQSDCCGHAIRGEDSVGCTRQYIVNKPLQWDVSDDTRHRVGVGTDSYDRLLVQPRNYLPAGLRVKD